MDPLHAMIALGPVAAYFLLLGCLNLSRRPIVVSGVRDTLALGTAVVGFVVAGPMELFLPEAAAATFGAWIWPMMLVFYVLLLTLIVLLMRPRIVIYNVTLEQLRTALAEVIAGLDPEARIAGDSIHLPTLGLQLYMEPFRAVKHVQLVSSGITQNYAGWELLERQLRKSLSGIPGTINPYGGMLIMFGLMMSGLIAYSAVYERPEITASLQRMLRRE